MLRQWRSSTSVATASVKIPVMKPIRTRLMEQLEESQETVGVSPQQFEEFVFTYQKPLNERFGGPAHMVAVRLLRIVLASSSEISPTECPCSIP